MQSCEVAVVNFVRILSKGYDVLFVLNRVRFLCLAKLSTAAEVKTAFVSLFWGFMPKYNGKYHPISFVETSFSYF